MYMSLAVIDCPRWVPVADATSWIRLLDESAIKMSPAASVEMPFGASNRAEVAAPPSPEWPEVPA